MTKILIVDDETNVCETLKSILEIAGDYEIFTANNGLDGLRIYEESRPDLLITDIKMPVRDGLWLIDHVRSDNRDIPIIMMSGFTSATFEEIESRKTQAFIRKPQDMSDILGIVGNVLQAS